MRTKRDPNKTKSKPQSTAAVCKDNYFQVVLPPFLVTIKGHALGSVEGLVGPFTKAVGVRKVMSDYVPWKNKNKL
jgi:hypothetical protein